MMPQGSRWPTASRQTTQGYDYRLRLVKGSDTRLQIPARGTAVGNELADHPLVAYHTGHREDAQRLESGPSTDAPFNVLDSSRIASRRHQFVTAY